MEATYDIVIIGCGGAGLPAALTAHEKGKRVLVLEKRGIVGGNALLAEGFFASESPAQKRLLIDAKSDQLFKTALDYAHYKIDPRIMRAFINKSGDTVQWIEDKGMKINRVVPFYPNQVPLVWHIVEGHGATLVNLFERECREKGIPILRHARAKKVLFDDAGRVSGVVAQVDGSEQTIMAQSVIICTGGFSGNKSLLAKYCPDYIDILDTEGVPGMDGDGLTMALEAGAATDGLGNLMMVGPSPFPKNWIVEGAAGEPYCLWVNNRGERFVDEAVTFNVFEAINAIVRQRKGICYAIFDKRIKDRIMECGLVRGCGEMFVPRGVKQDELDKEIFKQVNRGGAFVSESLDEIAQWIGASGSVLAKTIEDYNQSCDRKYDEIFVKDPQYLESLRNPPFYAIRFRGALLGTTGGIKINHRMEALDVSHNPIPGLYAAGADTGGWESDTYCAVLSGSAFGFALNSGRIAAESASEYCSNPLS
jgi:fumarate reductase flavoprotein subunit